MDLPEILTAARHDEAVELVRRYYHHRKKSGSLSTGAHFDNWRGGPRPETENVLTEEDFVAVSFLSVDVPPAAAIALLQDKAEEVTLLLKGIGPDRDLAGVKPSEFEELLGHGSAADQLRRLLIGMKKNKVKIGPTVASKIMARKRPKLIPIWDRLFKEALGLRNSHNQWAEWHGLLLSEPDLPQRLTLIGQEANAPAEASQLRIMDVVLWRHEKDRQGKAARK